MDWPLWLSIHGLASAAWQPLLCLDSAISTVPPPQRQLNHPLTTSSALHLWISSASAALPLWPCLYPCVSTALLPPLGLLCSVSPFRLCRLCHPAFAISTTLRHSTSAALSLWRQICLSPRIRLHGCASLAWPLRLHLCRFVSGAPQLHGSTAQRLCGCPSVAATPLHCICVTASMAPPPQHCLRSSISASSCQGSTISAPLLPLHRPGPSPHLVSFGSGFVLPLRHTLLGTLSIILFPWHHLCGITSAALPLRHRLRSTVSVALPPWLHGSASVVSTAPRLYLHSYVSAATLLWDCLCNSASALSHLSPASPAPPLRNYSSSSMSLAWAQRCLHVTASAASPPQPWLRGSVSVTPPLQLCLRGLQGSAAVPPWHYLYGFASMSSRPKSTALVLPAWLRGSAGQKICGSAAPLLHGSSSRSTTRFLRHGLCDTTAAAPLPRHYFWNSTSASSAAPRLRGFSFGAPSPWHCFHGTVFADLPLYRAAPAQSLQPRGSSSGLERPSLRHCLCNFASVGLVSVVSFPWHCLHMLCNSMKSIF